MKSVQWPAEERDLVASTLRHPSATPQSLALGDLPHNQQVVEFSSIPDLILSPVKTVKCIYRVQCKLHTGIKL